MRNISAAVVIGCFVLGHSVMSAADILLTSGVSLGPGESATLTVSLAKPASQFTYVSLTSSDTSKVTINPANIVFSEGATTPNAQPQLTGVSFGSATITASAFGLASASTSVPVSAKLDFGPNLTIAQGVTQTLFLTISSPPPTSQTIALTSDNPTVASVPPSVTIPANATYASFSVTALSGGSTVIRTNAPPNITPASVSVIVLAPGTITLTSNLKLQLGKSAPFPVSLGTPATPGGVFITLISSDNSRVTVSPASVFIAGGSTAPSTQPQVTGVNIGSASIIATSPGYASASQVVAVTATLTFLPQSVTMAAGTTQIVMLALSTSAPPDGFLATLKSDNSTIADVQPTLGYFPDGSSEEVNALAIRAIAPGTTVIHASAPPFIPDTTLSVTVVAPGTITLPTNLTVGVTQSAPFPVQLGTPAPPGGVNVTLSSSNPSTVTITPAVCFIAAGSTTPVSQPQANGLSLGASTISASAPGFLPASTLVKVTGGAPSTVQASAGTPQSALINTQYSAAFVATVLDADNNPVSGITVTFRAPAAGPSGVFVGGQSTVTATTDVAGRATAPLFIGNSTAGSYTVSAVVSGVPQPAVFLLTNTLIVVGPILLPPAVTLAPNQSVSFPVTLGTPAPAGGVIITLSSTDSSKVSIAPTSIFIAQGSSAPGAQPQVSGVNFGGATISASAPGFASATQTVQVTGAITFSSSDVTITGTATQNLTLTLSSPAPAVGLIVNLSSSNSSVATVPASVTFGSNTTSTVVPVTGVAPGSVTITAAPAAPNVASVVANITVKPAADIIIASGMVVAPGQSAPLAVSLTKPARQVEFITLASSDPSKVRVSLANLIILEGATTPTSQPQVVGIDLGQAAISASAFGLTGDSQIVKVTAALSFDQSSLTVPPAATQKLLLTMSAPSLIDQTISLSSDNPSVASVPPSVTIPANQTFAAVLVSTGSVGSAIIRATSPSNITPASLNVTVAALATITLPSNVKLSLGQSSPFPVALTTPAPTGGVTITLASSDATSVTISPSAVFVPSGSTVPLAQPQVTGENLGSSTITASAPGYASSNQVVPVKATLTFSPQNLTMAAGSTQIVMLSLSTAAPPNGFFATLSSDNQNVAQVQSTVGFFPDGSSVATNAIVITAVAAGTTIIHASATPFIPDTTIAVTVVGSATAPQGGTER